MLKFKTKEQGILLINDLLIKGYTKEKLREKNGIVIFEKIQFNPVYRKDISVKIYSFNDKEGTIYSSIWTWQEKLILKMIG